MFQHRGKITLVLVGLVIAAALIIPGLAGMAVSSVFVVLTLLLWALPHPAMRAGSGHTDAKVQQIAQVMLGLGLGMIGSMIFLFLQPPWSWLLLGVALVGIVGYLVYLLQK